MRGGSEKFSHSAWEREGIRMTLALPSSTWRESAGKMRSDFLQGRVVISQGGDSFKLEEGRIRLDTRTKTFTVRVVTGWREKLWMPHPWMHSRPGRIES